MNETEIVYKFSENAMNLLTELKTRTNATDYAEVLRRALSIYKWSLDCKEKGLEVGSIQGKEVIETVVFI
jgi:hypothetical protein